MLFPPTQVSRGSLRFEVCNHDRANRIPTGQYRLYNFLTDVRDHTNFDSTHPAYTVAQGVFQTFRRRLELKDAIRFANVLPVGLRALFVADWDPDEPRRPFEDRATMTREVQSLRPLHNYAPDDAIRMVADAVQRNVDREAFDRMLTTLPEEAVEFWNV